MANEDFTTYTEQDADGRLAETSARVTFTDMDNDYATYLYKDFGAGYFSANFRFNLDINLSAYTNGAGNHSLLALVNDLNSQTPNRTGSKPQLIILLGDETVTSNPIYAYETNAGSDYISSATSGLAQSTTYYVQFYRNESVGTYGTLYVDVYPTSADRTAGTNKISGVSLALHEKVDFRYVLCPQNSATTGGGASASGYIENLNLSVPDPATTVTVSGATAILSLGAVTTALTKTISEATAIFSAGAIDTAKSVFLSGATVIYSLGTMTSALTKTISEATVVFSSGAVSTAVSVLVSGATTIFSLGSLSFNFVVNISGGVVKFVSGLLKIVKDDNWEDKTKHISTWSGKTKNSSNWTHKNKS